MKTFKIWMEGQALGLSQDMKAFAKEASNAIQQGWEYDKIIYQRQVDSEKYGKKNVSVVIREPQGFGDAYAEPLNGEITIFLKPNEYKNIEMIIYHEIIHIFDPKTNNSNLVNSKWGINSQDEEDIRPNSGKLQNLKNYYVNPWEQDAYMRQSAEELINQQHWLFDGDKNQIMQSIKNIKPQDPWEQEWYKNPKMWRKYLNTIYQIFAQKTFKTEHKIMKTFKIWLESKEKNIRDTIVDLLGLDDDGLQIPLSSLNPNNVLSKLEPLGMWNSMPTGKKNEIEEMIKQQQGNVGDLIDKICDLGNNEIETPGILPPREEF